MVCTIIPFSSITASAETLKGDGDNDGMVTILDVRMALRFSMNQDGITRNQLKALDMDGNNRITTRDARKILQKVTETDKQEVSTPNRILAQFGYVYDAEQNIYYTSLNPWQRYFGFTDLYDDMAAYAVMFYQTLKIDFEYEGLLWRLQWWKGQYGALEGAELGVYTKKRIFKCSPFYKCAEDDNLLEMSFDYYHNVSDFEENKPLFHRPEQEHWWITGFKFGACNPTKNIVKATLMARDKKMADGIEAGLKNVTDKNGNPNGFVPFDSETDMSGYNYYEITEMEDGRYKFTVVWKDAGYLNYGTPENPEA